VCHNTTYTYDEPLTCSGIEVKWLSVLTVFEVDSVHFDAQARL
jgi:hypothetical protein